MLENLTEEELDFFDDFYYSPCLAECLFSDIDNMSLMEEEKFITIRPYQLPLLSHEYMLDEQPLDPNPNKNAKLNFLLRKMVGDCFALGGRLFGKTKILLEVDMLLSMIYLDNEIAGFTSYDAIHVKGVLEKVVIALESHPFFKLFEPRINKSPNYRFYLKNGYLLESVNQNLLGKSPGKAFFQKHFSRLYGDEVSTETDEIYQKRRDAVAEYGCIYRFAGMTDFTQQSICGQLFYDPAKKRMIVNLPQKVNPNWDENKRIEAIKDFGGVSSSGYRIFIDGEVAEDGAAVFDIERVRKCYNEEHELKTFEINKTTFEDFQNILIVTSPPNATEGYVTADIGESAPTEITIWFKINDRYRLFYNITLFNLIDKQQSKIFKWLGDTLKVTYIGIDTTDGTGRAIYHSLAEVFPPDHLSWVSFNEKMVVGFMKDNEGNVMVDENHKPIDKEEYVIEWSIQRLKHLFYNLLVDLPESYKLHKQVNNIVSRKGLGRMLYESKIKNQDHFFQSLQVFAITQWTCEQKNLQPLKSNFCKAGV